MLEMLCLLKPNSKQWQICKFSLFLRMVNLTHIESQVLEIQRVEVSYPTQLLACSMLMSSSENY